MPKEAKYLNRHVIRNRVYRYARRFYHFWMPSFIKRRLSFPPAALFVILLLLCLFSWGIVTYFTAKSTLNPVQQTADHLTQTSNYTDESQINEPAFDLMSLGLVHNDIDRVKKEAGFKLHQFNTLISERIGLRRPLPDTRHELCRIQSYASLATATPLLDTSVIICFFNEDFTTLQRTVYSVLERTPRIHLREIILVNDHSDSDIGDLLEKYRQSLEGNTQLRGSDADYQRKVRYFRVPERSGLIRARLYGSQFAQGQVLFFLDSHCEMNQQWLEPLLARIAANRKTIACPVIDLIDPDTFAYKPSPIVKGGFNWGLHFKWDSLPSEMLREEEDFIKPIKTPTMAGGLFAIERRYFQEMGTYDKGMDIWGGENIEISFRVWMCGGQLEIVPCSRVGHIFRHKRPYDSNADTLAYNSLRVAHVWMDKYKKYFLATRSDLSAMSHGDVQERVELRARLNCSSFEWYLKNVYPEMLTPEQEKQRRAEEEGLKAANKNLFHRKAQPVIAQFAIQLFSTSFCLASDSDMTYKGARLFLQECSLGSRLQRWKETQINDIRLGPKTCLHVGHDRQTKVSLSKCHEMGGTQLWQVNHSKEGAQLYNPGSGLCLGVRSRQSLVKMTSIGAKTQLADSLNLTMAYCSVHDSKQDDVWLYTRWSLLTI